MTIGLGSRRKLILLVDADPHARAALRAALEGAGFAVGEAANGAECARTVRRVHPDAILTDLMMETVDAGGEIAMNLAAMGRETPVYIVSTGGEALVGGAGLTELGISGVFLKPADPAIVIQTLRTRLGAP